jgi:hypothetical protein
MCGGFIDFRNRTAIVNIGIAALNSFLRDNIGQQHSALEGNVIGARWNALYREFSSQTVITDTTGFSLTGNQMQLPAPIADDPIPHCHVAIMLRQPEQFRIVDESLWQ